MVVEKGEKIHVVYRAYYENSTRRHFLGEVVAVDGPVCRLEGYVFVYDKKKEEYIRKPEKRITIIDVSESGCIANVIDPSVTLEDVRYRYAQNVGLIATDDKQFSLNINEFGSKN